MKILFIDGTGGFYPTRLDEKPTGGILTSLTLIPRYLVNCGHDVSVMSVYNPPPGQITEVYGVKYIGHPTTRTDFDVVIFNRNMMNRSLAEHFKASRKIWWLHDIVDPTYLEDDGYRCMDEIVALSYYCRDSYSDFYGIDSDKFTVIPNGVDKAVFYPGRPEARRRNLFITASAPIKGLYPLEYVFRNMQRWDKDMELRLYANQSLHGLENLETHKAVLSRLAAAGVKVMDPIPQAALADVFREATALLMPNHYPEICSNLLLQAQACGLPVIATDIGSAREYITHGWTGMLTRRTPSDMYWWWKDFAKQVADVYHDHPLRAQIGRASPSAVLSWNDVGGMWNDLLMKTAVAA